MKLRANGEQESCQQDALWTPFSDVSDRQYNDKLSAVRVDLSSLSVERQFDYGYTQIYDAAHDGTKRKAFEDGAIRIDYDGDFLNANRLDVSDISGFSWGSESTMKLGNVQAQVNTTHTTSGESVDLGKYDLDLSEGCFLVDRNDKIDAADSFFDRRINWNFDIDIDAVFGGTGANIEDFSEILVMIDALDWSTFDGDIEANTFADDDMDAYSWVGSEYDSGRIYKALGGTNELILNGINSADILSLNGEVFGGLTDYTTIGEQAIYQGTAFDILSLKERR